MTLESFLSYGISSGAKDFLLDKIPLFLLIFAFIFLAMMIVLFSLIKLDNIALVGIPSFIISLLLAWFIMRGLNPWLDVPALIISSFIPLLVVALFVVMVAQILKFLW